MSSPITVSAVPFDLTPRPAGAWAVEVEPGVITGTAAGHTDLYVNPGGGDSADAESLLNAATLLGLPPEGDFIFSARVRVEFTARFDAGVLLLWMNDDTWAKLCLECSPAGEPMVVSVVTRGVSDDANAFVVTEPSVSLRVSRLGEVYAFHASTDARHWQLIRVFALGGAVGEHRLGLESQAPTGAGCRVTFDRLSFSSATLDDLRDGS